MVAYLTLNIQPHRGILFDSGDSHSRFGPDEVATRHALSESGCDAFVDVSMETARERLPPTGSAGFLLAMTFPLAQRVDIDLDDSQLPS